MKILFLSIILLFTANSLIAENLNKKNKVAVMYSDQFLLHDTGKNHPENPSRLLSVVEDLISNPLLKPYLIWPKFTPATTDQLQLAHTKSYIKTVELETDLLKNNSISYLSTGDTVISKQSNHVARLAVGAGIKAVDMIMSEEINSAFALVRPPGHHATASRGMGFCIYNNVAIVARHLQQQHDLKKILIVDFDVHHGNGTQDIFYEDNSVFYFSVHQHPFYPQSGRPTEKGIGKGKGFTLNVDLPKGSGNKELLNTFKNQLKPAMDKFKPEFVLVSAGFDAHEGDLLGQLNYTSTGYKQTALILKDIAEKYALGRTLYMLEGGYVAKNISQSVNEILGVLANK
ncbi:histone deacetylase [Methylophilaceae bacterium]|nr:histone deacetylase [Methylophilaceae bacterium]